MGLCSPEEDPILAELEEGEDSAQEERKFEPDRIDLLILAGCDSSMFLRGLKLRNPYGYEINISHPVIAPMYEAFKRKRRIPPWCPLSDAQRMTFEELIFEMLTQKNKGEAKEKSA